MSITRLDLAFQKTRQSARVAALNAFSEPGSLVLTLTSALRESVGSQIATTLSHDHIIEELSSGSASLNPMQLASAENSVTEEAVSGTDATSEVLQKALRAANRSVYEFGHKLAAGGRTACTGVVLILRAGSLSVARAGEGGAYLVRGKVVFPFFEPIPPDRRDLSLDRYLGANAFLTAEISSVPVEPGDTLYVFDREADDPPGLVTLDSAALDSKALLESAVAIAFNGRPPVIMACIKIGADTVFLRNEPEGAATDTESQLSPNSQGKPPQTSPVDEKSP